MALKHVVAFAGGVGGAKLADGLARLLPDHALTVIVNIGDDFERYGLHISPDLDTVTYTLGGVANSETGWGLAGESWQTLEMLHTYGEEPWFRLGDKDIATHLLRTSLLREGVTLTAITDRLRQALNIRQYIRPASDDRCATMVDTVEHGTLAFQEYFVRHRWQPTVRRVWYDGVEKAMPSLEVVAALENADAIIICPSNPVLSIDPILALGDVRSRLLNRRVPCVAVSPLIHGQAVKGPAPKIMQELGQAASTEGLLAFYNGLIDLLIVDHGDGQGQLTWETDILMPAPTDRERLARDVLVAIERV